MFGIPDMWFALGLVLIFAFMGAGLGVAFAWLIIKTGACGHPQCQPGYKKSNTRR